MSRFRLPRPYPDWLRLAVIAVLLLALLLPAVVLAARPMVKITLVSQGPVWVGQKTVIAVKLYSPTYFSGAPRFDLPEVPGLVMMKVPGRPVVGSERIGEDRYSVQRHEFFAYPQRAGDVTIPPFPVQFGVAGVGMAKPSRHVMKTRQLHFAARMPAGAEHLQTLISAHELDVRESWHPKPEDPVVGDAFTRTISFRAPDIPGMAFPPIPSMAVPGLAIYPAPPHVQDKVSRGDLVGERRETIPYVCETPGVVNLPALVFHWWDLSAGKLRRIEFPAVRLHVAPDPDLITSIANEPLDDGKPHVIQGLLIGSAVSLLVLLLYFFRRRISLALRQRCRMRMASEPRAFAQLLGVCRQQNPVMVLNLFWVWIEQVPADCRVVTLDDFLRCYPQAQLADELHGLEQAVLGRRTDWVGTALARCLKETRKELFAKRQRSLKRALPGLNPRHK